MGEWTRGHGVVLSSPPNRYLFSSRYDSIYTEKKAKKNPAGLIALRDEKMCIAYYVVFSCAVIVFCTFMSRGEGLLFALFIDN